MKRAIGVRVEVVKKSADLKFGVKPDKKQKKTESWPTCSSKQAGR